MSPIVSGLLARILNRGSPQRRRGRREGVEDKGLSREDRGTGTNHFHVPEPLSSICSGASGRNRSRPSPVVTPPGRGYHTPLVTTQPDAGRGEMIKVLGLGKKFKL